jgi:hypothetical protein
VAEIANHSPETIPLLLREWDAAVLQIQDQTPSTSEGYDFTPIQALTFLRRLGQQVESLLAELRKYSSPNVAALIEGLNDMAAEVAREQEEQRRLADG